MMFHCPHHDSCDHGHGVLPDPDSLDAAWAEAEAALPEDKRITCLSVVAGAGWAALTDGPWSAYDVTPVAALRALAAKLRESR